MLGHEGVSSGEPVEVEATRLADIRGRSSARQGSPVVEGHEAELVDDVVRDHSAMPSVSHWAGP
jgi:hypothetical protein